MTTDHPDDFTHDPDRALPATRAELEARDLIALRDLAGPLAAGFRPQAGDIADLVTLAEASCFSYTLGDLETLVQVLARQVVELRDRVADLEARLIPAAS